MNRNFYLNIIATLGLICLGVFSYVVSSSVDLLRFRVEGVSKQVATIGDKLERIDEQLSSIKNAPVVLANNTVNDSSPATDEVNASTPMANAEFYDQTAPFGGRMISATSSETKNLNYLVNNEYSVSVLWDYCSDSLASRNFENPAIFQPQLAESWSLSEDKMTYTIKIKKGVLWHDFKDPVNGKEWRDKEVTAHDFKFYVDTIKNEDVDCLPSRIFLKDLIGVEVVSDYEFLVKWRKKYFLSETITLGLSPLPRHLYHAYEGPFDGKRFNDDHERNRIIVGCGPYRFVCWDKGQRIILKRWEKYYGYRYGVRPTIENRVYEVIKHPNTQFQSLVSGSIDMMGLTPEQWVNRTDIPAFDPKKGGNLRKIKYPARNYQYIGYNLTNPLFKDKLTRQALTHLVDRERIIKEVLHGLARIITGPFYIDTPHYDKSVKPWPYSVEKAKELLAKAGWKDTNNDGILERDGKNFEFTILGISSSTTLAKMLPIIKEDMAKAGIVVNISNVEWSVYLQRLEKKKFDVCVLGWALSYEGDPYQLWHSSQADADNSSNHIGFKNKKADEIIEKIRVCFNLDERVKLCHEFHELLHDLQPYTFLFSPDALFGLNTRYQNVKVYPTGLAPKAMWVPKSEQKKVSF